MDKYAGKRLSGMRFERMVVGSTIKMNSLFFLILLLFLVGLMCMRWVSGILYRGRNLLAVNIRYVDDIDVL